MPQRKKQHFDGKVLRGLRKGLNWTQTRLATEVGVELKTVWNWENGKTTPSDEMIDRLCQIFDVDRIDFLSVVASEALVALIVALRRGGDSPTRIEMKQTEHALMVAEKLKALPVASLSAVDDAEDWQDNPFKKPMRGECF